MKDSLFIPAKLVYLSSGEGEPDSWGNPYNKGNKLEKNANLIENDPRFGKLNELGKKLSRFADNLPKDSKPFDIKSEEDGISKVRKLLIKKENTKIKVSIFEKKSDNFLIKSDYYFDTTTGKYLNGLTSVKFNEDILKNKEANPFALLKILPPIIESKPLVINKAERILNRKSVSSR